LSHVGSKNPERVNGLIVKILAVFYGMAENLPHHHKKINNELARIHGKTELSKINQIIFNTT
tara:strand:- start:16702 stop:16887 length:186 start_codon:yes stop_codon:yes gene_type:complete